MSRSCRDFLRIYMILIQFCPCRDVWREIDDGDEGAFAAPKQTDVFTVLKRSFRMVIGKLRELLCFFFLEEYQHHRKGNSETENSSDDTVCEVVWNGRRDVADHGEEVGWSELVVTDIHDAQV